MEEVVAIARGYYGKLREIGEKFEVEKGAKATWFVPTKKAEISKPAPKPAGK